VTPILEARGVTRILPAAVPVTLVRDVSLSIGPGEFAAITGPSGSGKSSLLYLLGLLDVPTSGEVLVDGHPTATMDDDARAALRLSRIGFVFQFHFLLPEFSVRDNVLTPMRRLGRLGEAAMRARADSLLDALGIAAQAGKRPDQLSGGQRQRVAVARALANDPEVVLADEPTGSLDSAASEQVFELLRDVARNDGRAVVAVTHDHAMADRMDRRIHLVDGAVVSDQRREAVPAA
jgi:lipoprotein-releasing system ATP-binding protein